MRLRTRQVRSWREKSLRHIKRWLDPSEANDAHAADIHRVVAAASDLENLTWLTGGLLKSSKGEHEGKAEEHSATL